MKNGITTSLIVASLAYCCAAELRAERLLHLEIEKDGEIVLQGEFSDNSGREPAFIWHYFSSVPLHAQGDSIIPEFAGQPPRSTVDGDIQLRIRHDDQVLAEAGVETLTLRPFPNHDTGWQVAPDEVDRTAVAANLPLPTGEAMTGPGVAVSAVLVHPKVVGLLLLGALLVGLLLVLSISAMRSRNRSA